MEKKDLRSCSAEDLAEICRENDVQEYRARQVFEWVHQKGAQTWEEVRSIGGEAREKLSRVLFIEPPEVVREQYSRDGTRKYLFRLPDGEQIESVLMGYSQERSRERRTVCLSVQVGCPVGCLFCATGQEGFKRNLTAGEIVGQVLDIVRARRIEDPGFKVTNVVFMGMGEPFLNTEKVLQAVQILNDAHGQNIGMRRMTISTSGVVPGIQTLAARNPQIGLAVSLHAARDELRDILVPMNRRYPLAELMEACRAYSAATRRRVTFEMAVTEETCRLEEAHALGRLLKGMLAHVNVIPVNPVTGSGLKRPSSDQIRRYIRAVEAAGIAISLREEKGSDIDAACGQLRQRAERETSGPVNER